MDTTKFAESYLGDISLLEEIGDEDAFGGFDFSDWLAWRQGLGGDGFVCTLSAECAGTRSCWPS